MNYTIIFVFLLSLMFLTMIFGERLSLFGVLDGRWWTAPFDLVNFVWGLVCEAADRLWCFVFDHFWWVTATVTGSIGIALIAIMMVGGLTSEARAVRRDSETLLNAGSVLDAVPEIRAEEEFTTAVESSDSGVSHVMWQFPSDNRFAVPSLVRQPIIERPAVEPPPFDPPPFDPPLDLPYRNERPLAVDYSRDQLKITLEPYLERQGQPTRSVDMDAVIQKTMRSLRDDWQTVSQRELENRYLGSGRPLPEDPQFLLDDLYDQVRVLPGDFVSENNLLVEKDVPPGPLSGEFDIIIRVRNQGLDSVSGIVVRELLPTAWSPLETMPQGVFRDSTITWLLPALASREVAEVRVRVQSTERGAFQSFTEVSATGAVSTPAEVLPERRPLPRIAPEPEPEPDPIPPRTERRSLPPVGFPRLRLTFDDRPTRTTVGKTVDVVFRIENIGTEAALDVDLLIDVPLALDHWRLEPTDINRTLQSSLPRIEPGESIDRTLTVTPDRAGRHVPSATLLREGITLDTRDFEIVADEELRRDDPILPRPDRISQ